MPVEEEKASRLVAGIAATSREAVFDHISDHRPVRSTWKRWRQEVRKAGISERKAWERAGKNQKKCFSGLWDQDAASPSLATRTMKNGCFREKTTVFWILSMFFRPLLMHSLKYIMFVSLS